MERKFADDDHGEQIGLSTFMETSQESSWFIGLEEECLISQRQSQEEKIKFVDVPFDPRKCVDPSQKSVARPPKLQSPWWTGSRLGPPTSPVFGLTSPWNSGTGFLTASGWSSSPFSRTTWFAAAGVAAARTRSSNSFWSLGASGGGPGLVKETLETSDADMSRAEILLDANE